MYRNLGLNVVESFRSTEWSEDYAKKHIRIEGLEHIEKTVAEGHGTIFLSGHIGNWELMAFICPHLPTQAHIVVKDLKPPELNDLVVSTREKIGVRVISRKNSGRTQTVVEADVSQPGTQCGRVVSLYRVVRRLCEEAHPH